MALDRLIRREPPENIGYGAVLPIDAPSSRIEVRGRKTSHCGQAISLEIVLGSSPATRWL
jgi:hypothetical protein